MDTAIVWFRRDLRLTDNPALTAAVAAARHVLPVYIHSPEEDGAGAPGAASRWWLHYSLAALSATLRDRGSPLVIHRGPAAAALRSLVAETGATGVFWNRTYEPAGIARDTDLKTALRELGVEVQSFNGSLLFEPWEVLTGSGGPYRVYTPFWRQCQTRLGTVATPLAAPARLVAPPKPVSGVPLGELSLLPTRPWGEGLAAAFTPGEAAGQAKLVRFAAGPIDEYKTARDLPAETGTARLSPHLHFGEVSPRQALAAALGAGQDPARRAGGAVSHETFIKELVWREFSYHVLYHYPHTVQDPLDPRFRDMPWTDDGAALRAWQRGLTGVPLVDAGMRELYATGWMHNRVRMVVASFLCKNLGQHWRSGAAWFHDTLVDADLAANTFGWQWSAGCGADAAPYYRIFSPRLQAERFDPTRTYIRRWVPELARLPDSLVHRPFEAPAAELAAAGIRLGRDYPAPVVDLKASRAAALAGYATMRGEPGLNPPPAAPRTVRRAGK